MSCIMLCKYNILYYESGPLKKIFIFKNKLVCGALTTNLIYLQPSRRCTGDIQNLLLFLILYYLRYVLLLLAKANMRLRFQQKNKTNIYQRHNKETNKTNRKGKNSAYDKDIHMLRDNKC